VSERPYSKDDAKQGYVVAALVLMVSLGLGLFGLPRLGRHRLVSDSPLSGRPAQDFMLPVLSADGPGKSQRLSDLQGTGASLGRAEICRAGRGHERPTDGGSALFPG